MKKSRRPVSEKKLRAISARFMRKKEYAKHLGISERALSDWIRDGLIPYLKVKDHLVLIDPIKADAALQRLEKAEVKI
jgi:predicted site-specific integrase-resolvase